MEAPDIMDKVAHQMKMSWKKHVGLDLFVEPTLKSVYIFYLASSLFDLRHMNLDIGLSTKYHLKIHALL